MVTPGVFCLGRLGSGGFVSWQRPASTWFFALDLCVQVSVAGFPVLEVLSAAFPSLMAVGKLVCL